MSWTSLTQAQRNQAIINAGVAAQSITGYNCKNWVRLVVQNASNGAGGPQRNIPATKASPNEYMWESDPYAIGQSTTMQLAALGWIIQMKFKSASNPSVPIEHTAILHSRDANGFYFLDSNFHNNNVPDDHYMTFTDFNNRLFGLGQFSAYLIQ